MPYLERTRCRLQNIPLRGGSRFHVVAARDKIKALIEALKFSLDVRGMQRAAARIAGKPLETRGIVAG